MAKDPAFLFYPGDASEDTQFMNRLERGCYFDLLKAQKKFSRFTLDQIKKVLGRDFEACWPALELCLKVEDGKYFIEWISEAIENRKKHSKIQKDRVQKYWDDKKKNQGSSEPIPRNESGNSVELPLENAIENENVIKKENIEGGPGETKKLEILNSQIWIESIAMQKKIPQEEVVGYLEEFLADLVLKEDFGKPVREIKKHFISWLNIQLKNIVKNGKNKRITPEPGGFGSL